MKAAARIIQACVLLQLLTTGALAQEWQHLDSIAITRRIGASYCTLEGKGYVAFGHDHNSRYPFNDLWEFDPRTLRWKNIDYLDGQFRTHAFMFGANGAIYFGGGTVDSGKSALTSFARFDLK